jgi:hypothetical protein
MDTASVDDSPQTALDPTGSPPSTPRRAARFVEWLRVHGVTLAASIPLALLTWPVSKPYDSYNVDASWQIGLQLAARDGLVYGRDVVFTYGPLGFLARALFFVRGPGQLAMLTQGIAWLVLAALVMAAIGTVVRPVALRLVVALVVLLVISTGPQSMEWIGIAYPVFVAICVALLGRSGQRWTVPVSAALATTGTLLFLIKGNVGLAVWVVGGLTIACGSWLEGGARRALLACGAFIAAVVVSTPLIWVLIGQPLGSIGDWLGPYWQFVTGYSEAMGETFAAADFWWLWFAVVALPVATVATVFATRRIAVARRSAIAMVIVAATAFAFKFDFTRHTGTDRYFLLFLALALGLTVVSTPQRLVLASVALLLIVLALRLQAGDVFDVGEHVEAFQTSAQLVGSRDAQDRRIREQRAGLGEGLQVADIVLDRVGKAGVHAVPIDAAVVYLHPELRWRPLPIIQDYANYTLALDDLQSRAMVGDRRPEYLIRRKGFALDGRLPRFEGPGANLTLLCNYRFVLNGGGTELFQAGRDRCGPPEPLRTTTARFGEPISVPRSDDALVVARMSGVNGSLGARLEALAVRGRKVFVSPDSDQWFRYLPGTQGSWHVLDAPACLGPSIQNTGPQFDSFTLSDRAGPSSSHDEYQIELARIPIRCPS